MPAALQNHGKAAAWKTSVAHVQKHRNSCYFCPVTKILPTKRPPFWGPGNGLQNGGHSLSLNLNLLVSGRLGPRFGVRLWTPKRGPFVGKFFAAWRKIVQVSIVSAGTRQKFCIPLGHWVPMVLQRREQLFSTPCERLCPHMFLNWGGPLWRDRFLLGFLDPKLVSRKITFSIP